MEINIRDIVLAPFPYTDLSDNKLRPGLVLFLDDWDVTLVFITSNLDAGSEFDVIVQPDSLNRLRKPSLFKITKLCTIDIELMELKYGSLSIADFKRTCDSLTIKIQSSISG